MKRWYFTFGFDRCPHGYVTVEAPDYATARAEMCHRYSTWWAFDYDEEAFLPQIEKYNLREAAHIYIPLGSNDKEDAP